MKNQCNYSPKQTLRGRLVMRLHLRFKQNTDATRLVKERNSLLFMGSTIFLRPKRKGKKNNRMLLPAHCSC
jgi:hypothetical protein